MSFGSFKSLGKTIYMHCYNSSISEHLYITIILCVKHLNELKTEIFSGPSSTIN